VNQAKLTALEQEVEQLRADNLRLIAAQLDTEENVAAPAGVAFC
jgi:hypothetical protein